MVRLVGGWVDAGLSPATCGTASQAALVVIGCLQFWGIAALYDTSVYMAVDGP
jgi:hypothetical protein